MPEATGFIINISVYFDYYTIFFIFSKSNYNK